MERHFCESCARRTLWVPKPVGQGVVEAPAGAEVPVEVERVIFSGSDMQLLMLREVGGLRRLSFPIGHFEPTAIWWALKREPSARPFTYQAWVNTIAALGAKVRSAVVVARRGDIYFAELRMIRDGTPLAVDVRPSDALLVSLYAGVPFSFVEPLLAADFVSEPEPAEPDTAPDRDRRAGPGR